MDSLPEAARKVQAALEALGLHCRVTAMPDTTRTAEEAARTIGCHVGQIAKTVLFRGERSGKPLLVIASGLNRVDERLMAERAGEGLVKPRADFVREATGYAIGGVPPIGFPRPIETWIDEDLLQYPEVWAAAGTPNAVFNVDPARLAAMTGGTVARVR